jgi:hypothetical protein
MAKVLALEIVVPLCSFHFRNLNRAPVWSLETPLLAFKTEYLTESEAHQIAVMSGDTNSVVLEWRGCLPAHCVYPRIIWRTHLLTSPASQTALILAWALAVWQRLPLQSIKTCRLRLHLTRSNSCTLPPSPSSRSLSPGSPPETHTCHALPASQPARPTPLSPPRPPEALALTLVCSGGLTEKTSCFYRR